MARVEGLLGGRRDLVVLEAGCGSISYLPLKQPLRIVGLDISPKQLERNRYIHERILGDIQTYPLPFDCFDLIVSWDLLEHLPEPQKALLNMFKALKPGGLIVLAAPCLWSIKGLFTKLTPQCIHVLFYRRLIGDKRAGRNDFGPFPTYLRPATMPSHVISLAGKNGLVVEYLKIYEGPVSRHLREHHKIAGNLLALLNLLSKVLTFGRVDLSRSDYHLIMRKINGARPGPSFYA